MRFYDGKKIESSMICRNIECGQEIIWYNLFAQSINNSSFTCSVLPTGENISSATVDILNRKENELDVLVGFRCRLCDEPHRLNGIIKMEGNKLIFIESTK